MTDWKKKLLAYLHDPPCKPFNIHEHRAIARNLIVAAGLDPDEAEWFFAKVCDHTAAAADRVVCPRWSAMHAEWSLHRAFKHPLGGGALTFAEDALTPEQAEAKVAQAQERLNRWQQLPAERQDWGRFFLHWRLWPQYCAEIHPSLHHLPADTRIPDHSVWTHCSLVSALTSCVQITGQGEGMSARQFKPAFLLVQIGPVQEFIAQARTTRDLWSGSYLLSWLIAHGIKAITDVVGPDCILFPALRGQPLFDFLHKKDLYVPAGCWDDLRHADEAILTPNLPNRFLAVVPAWEAEDLARKADVAMRDELSKAISKGCLDWFEKEKHPLESDAVKRWRQQLRQFLTVHWQVWPWAGDVQTAIENFERLPTGKAPANSQGVAPAKSLERAFVAATKGIPLDDLDPRNYRHKSWKDGDSWRSEVILSPEGLPQMDNSGFAWAAHYGAVEFWLAARRNTRDFEPWGQSETDSSGNLEWLDLHQRCGATKDVLSGKEESIGSPEWQKKLADLPGHLFRQGERLGALNLMKRIWHVAYLEKHGLKRSRVAFDSVPAIAAARWRRELLDRMREDEPTWQAFLHFARKSAEACPSRHFDVPKEAPDESSRMDESRWLARLDATALHKNEWQRAIAEETNGGIEILKEALSALEDLQRSKRDGGLGRPLPYVAVIAIDGDSMGEWVSGAKSPRFAEQLAEEARAYFERAHSGGDALALQRLLEAPRHVSPSYHLQFSEALANFSLYLARPIVEFFDGQLIYSGGDDVLAMVPAENALKCCRALRMAFRGDPELCTIFGGVLDTRARDAQGKALPPDEQPGWGFVAVNGEWPGYSSRERKLFPRGYHLLVPGKNADLSAGIAIGHMHTPLQNLIEAARQAERSAKREAPLGYAKAAFAVHLYKRSGEIIHWGAKWEDAAIDVADRFGELTEAGMLTARFPYALSNALRPYAARISAQLPESANEFRIATANGFNPMTAFDAEFRHALRQHGSDKWRNTEDAKSFASLINRFLGECANRRLDDFLGPFLTTTFIHKGAD